MSKTAETEYGAIYNRKDYLGFGRRLGILFIDLITFSLIAIIIALIVAAVFTVAGMPDEDPRYPGYTFILVVIAALIYFPVLKATKAGTVGYRLFKARLVNLKGERASLLKSTMRFMFVFIGPFNFLFDLIWMGGNKHRQTFRDLFLGTYVIRRSAEPVSRGRIVYPTYDIASWNFTCSEVEDDRE